MIYLLWGTDTYRSLEKLREITAEFRKRSGDFDVQNFDGELDSPKKLGELFKGISLFQKKKLLVIRQPSLGKEPMIKELGVFLRTISEDPEVITVIWEGEKAEKIAALAKKYGAKIQEFRALSPSEERRWLGAYVKERNLSLGAREIETVTSLFSGDTWRLVNEIEKLALGGEMGAVGVLESSFYSFTDALFLHKERALEALIRLRLSGANEFMLFGWVASHLRSLIAVASGTELAGLSPNAIAAARRKLPRISREALEPSYQRLFREDIKIKTGRSDPFTALIDLVLLD